MKNARNFYTATLLPNGKVLVAGGFNLGNSAELYDPATDTWTLTSSLRVVRAFHTATLLPSGQVLVAGGGQSGGSIQRSTSAELYELTGKWTLTGSMKHARAGHTATLLPNGKVLVVGGGTGSELYDPATGIWSETASPSTGGTPPTLLANGKVLAGPDFYDPATGKWTTTGAPSRSYNTATLLLNGKVLAAGGNRTFTAELYDPDSGTWSATGALTWDRDGCRATLLRNWAGVDHGWIPARNRYTDVQRGAI
jgi:WD40 repeat protein